MRNFIVIMLLLISNSAYAADKLKVVASFSILGDMVHELAGDAIELKTLVGPNGDTHEYEPTPADAKALSQADLVLVNGLELEGWMERLIQSSGYRGKVVVASQGITLLNNDPHGWQSLTNGKIYVTNIRDALVNADPVHAATYNKNAQSYNEQLTALDAWVRAQIATVPAEKRKVISTHDAFTYFADAYGVTFIAPLGTSTQAQPSAKELAKLVDQIRAKHVTAVFFENMTDSRLMKQLKKDAGAHIGGTLYSDALSAANEPAPSYIAMFKHNVPQLVQAMRLNP